jgi:hypothetical protein
LLDEMYSPQVASTLRARGIDAVSVHERPQLVGEPDDREVLRAATRERRVLVSNNAKDLVPIVDELGLAGETHFGVLLTNDSTFPRTRESIGLMTRSLMVFASDRKDEEMRDDCQFLQPT